MSWVVFGAFVAACAVSLLLTPLSIFLANRLNLLDRPDARKVHSTAIPRLGGIGIIGSAFIVAVPLYIYVSGALPDGAFSVGKQYLALLLGGLCVFAVGVVDDLYSVSSRFKLVAILAATFVVCGAGGAISEFRSVNVTLVELPWASWAITALWIAGVTVSFNFIDGLDGLSGGIGLLACLVLSIFLIDAGQYAAAVAPLALAGGITGFLYFNWHPAKTFMGDGGSLTIGFLIGSMTAISNPSLGTLRSVILPGLAMSVALVDAALTIFRRRYQQRRSIFSAERGHIHHRLLDRGFSHPQAVIVIHAVSIACVLVGVFSMTFDGMATFGGLALVVPILWGLFHAAGSMRTGEMVTAVRRKRDLDRSSRQRRDTFESLQLEFDNVKNFSEWWRVVCAAAARLEFGSLEIRMGSTRNGKPRVLSWTSEDDSLSNSPETIEASIPTVLHGDSQGDGTTTVRIPATDGLESAGQRLALFSRLLAESGDEALVRLKASSTATTVKKPAIGKGEFGELKVAVVHDFFYTYCGAERVVEQMINVFPHCDVFGLFDFMPEEDRGFLRGKRVESTFVQKLPFARSMHRSYLPLMPLAIEQLDVSQYDLVISSSYLAAKGVITGPDQLHICYCHSPVRYGWDLHHQYLDEAGLRYGPKGILARMILHYIRNWDARSSLGVDRFIANSKFVARRIEKVYRRQADVIHPPVDTEQFTPDFDQAGAAEGEYYLTASRLVGYKRIDLIVSAFSKMADRKLIVAGDGPEMERLKQIAASNVELVGYQGQDELIRLMRGAKAFVFAAEEDFGIVPVEAMACGTPVIAYGKGGVTESVREGKTGVFFPEQTPDSIVDAVERFESAGPLDELDRKAARQRAEQFSCEQFQESLKEFVRQEVRSRWPELPLRGLAQPEETPKTKEPPRVDSEPPVAAG